MGLWQVSSSTGRRSHPASGATLYTCLVQLVILHQLSVLVTGQEDARFPLVNQCLRRNIGASLNKQSINFCMDRGGGLIVKFPGSICPDANDAIIIGGYEVLTPKESFVARRRSGCNSREVDGFNYASSVNSSCLQRQGFSRQVKNAILPLMRMYNGLSTRQMQAVETIQYHRRLGPDEREMSDFTWLSLFTKCVEKETTTKLLNSDICDNSEQSGAHIVHIEFRPHGGVYVNQSSCSCNIVSRSRPGDPNEQTLTARAVDIRLAGSSAVLNLVGKGNSRVLDGSEILYWDADGDLLSSTEQLYLKLDRLDLRALPERMWLEVRGTNLTVNCGPADQPGGHQPLAAESSTFGITYIIAIIAGLVILIVLLLVLFKYVYQRKQGRRSRKDEDDDYDISMGSKEDIRDRYKLNALRQQMSNDSGVEPAVEIKTEVEVMCSNPRLASSPGTEADESQRALLHDGDEEEDGNGNNNTTTKKPPVTPPPPPHDPHHHEYLICRQLSYIDEDEAALPPPPPTEEIYNHLNEHQRPDVVPGNIYDTKPMEQNHYSTTTPKKRRAPDVPLPEDNYVT
ncbi:hypothetical protein EGW08_020959 [Elysia chlorotica]|uniref:CUB domain-containing protein n=1 Tax=Elysia chlorotica TaxID=188477 RepID=A0A3S1AY16_ELYCH|nr:hypothetical protein EGW08_020959 [Elysia chlorotica]